MINEDTRKLRELYDSLESHVRCLKSLGIPSDSYGSLLSSIIMSKQPQELRLIISREIEDQEWQLDTIMRVLENELEAREGAVLHNKSQSSAEGQAFPNFQRRTTTSLFAKHSGPTCRYCKQSHPSNSCKMVTTLPGRTFSSNKEDVLFASERIISGKTVLQSMNVSSVRVNTISAFSIQWQQWYQYFKNNTQARTSSEAIRKLLSLRK